MTAPVQVAIDCEDPARLAAFWAAALGYEVMLTGAERALAVDPTGSGPRLFFHLVPEPKVVKNRLHLDVFVSGMGTPKQQSRPIVDAAVARLVAAGATHVRSVEEESDYYAVMHDPEGNEFCIG